MNSLQPYIKAIEDGLQHLSLPDTPDNLYQPFRYSLSVGGKRIRPVLTLLSAELFGATLSQALPAALSVEIFHNFTLVHDDIMDEAPLRRGQATVHKKWNRDIAILSGDVMMIYAYKQLQEYPSDILTPLLKIFNQTAIEVCEGQQMDMNFESDNAVSIADYLTMISLKTSVLLAASLQMGAIVAQATENQQQAIYHFGKNLGIAFQLQDDLLDTFGDEKHFGKKIGGDIVARKKTFLYLKALENANAQQRKVLEQEYSGNSEPDVNTVKDIFLSTRADEYCRTEIQNYFNASIKALNSIGSSHHNIKILQQLSEQLIHRTV